MNHKESADDKSGEHSDREQPPKEKADNLNQQTHLPGPSQGKSWPIVQLVFIMLGEVAIVVWMLSEHFFNSSSPVTAGILLYCAIVFLATYGVHNVVKSSDFNEYRKHTKAVWNCYCLVCLLLATVFVVTLWPRPRPRPHLTLGVKVLGRSAFADWPLPLTNDFVLIAITNGLQPFSLPYDAGYLITLVPHGQSEVPLVFTLLNDSDEIVELAEVKVSVSSEIPCVYGPGWGNPLPDTSSTNLWFEYGFSRPFLPRDACDLPFIRLAAGADKPVGLAFMVRAKNMPFLGWGFWAAFPMLPAGITNLEVKPQIVRGIMASAKGEDKVRLNLKVRSRDDPSNTNTIVIDAK